MAKSGSNKIPAPKGTRDLYPQDLLRQRYITEGWRRVSIRHGFDEIAGPTFEMLDLYKKKSGDGIVSELFSFTRAGGDDDYALRPEFTPTLARMYAERAKQLPSPCKWFTAGPYFRAEKPQRGRLREFMQWNCDVLGSEAPQSDADTAGVMIGSMVDFGFDSEDVALVIGDRIAAARLVFDTFERIGEADSLLAVLDRWGKVDARQRIDWETKFNFRHDDFVRRCKHVHAELIARSEASELLTFDDEEDPQALFRWLRDREALVRQAVGSEWIKLGIHEVVRGLAYYTGTVFELIADGERAVAGGGRYDNLIELFGGPSTPAVGFGMGDVVLGLLLEDKGLMPDGPDLAEAVSQKPASIRPEAFVIANEDGEPHIEPLLAELRRGRETEGFEGKPWDSKRYKVAPMHSRRSYKSTKNIGKLLADARKQHAKFAIIIENDSEAKIENLDTRQEVGTFSLDQIGAELAEHL